METGVEVVCLFLFIVPGIVHIGAIKYILKEEEDHKSIAKEELITQDWSFCDVYRLFL